MLADLACLLFRGLSEAPGLVYGVPDGRGSTEAAVFVGVVDDQDRGFGEEDAVVAGQPVEGLSELRFVLVKGATTRAADEGVDVVGGGAGADSAEAEEAG